MKQFLLIASFVTIISACNSSPTQAPAQSINPTEVVKPAAQLDTVKPTVIVPDSIPIFSIADFKALDTVFMSSVTVAVYQRISAIVGPFLENKKVSHADLVYSITGRELLKIDNDLKDQLSYNQYNQVFKTLQNFLQFGLIRYSNQNKKQ